MRVAVLADHLRRWPASGIATYGRGLLQGLRAMADERPAVTLVAGRIAAHPDPLTVYGWPIWSSRLPSPVVRRLWERGLGLRTLDRFDVVHATSVAAPTVSRVPLTVMVHDLAFRQVPDTFSDGVRRWHEAAFERIRKSPACVMVPAEVTADAVIAAGVARERVVVIPEGCDHLPPPDAGRAGTLLTALGVPGPYLLSVSALEPRKNLPGLIAAYRAVRGRLPEAWPLLVVGPKGWGPDVAPADGVVLAGVVPDAVLAALYAGARCLAYVPFLEGWGLPPVEAMAAGTPVVASPMPSTGGAALEVDPHDVDSVADALLVAATDEHRRASLVAAGRARASTLTWERAAREHVAVWHGVSGRRR